MLIAGITLAVSIVLLIVLFSVKYWELKHDRVLFPHARVRLDSQARRLKDLIVAARLDVAKLVPVLLRITRRLLHTGALTFASLARLAEYHAHRFADLVSYKHRFERRETRSEFLKKVSEHKNGNGLGSE
jgi:hypothetical protein